MGDTIKFPAGNADVFVMSATGAQAVAVANTSTFVDGVTTEATGNLTLNITPDAGLKVGSTLVVASKANGTETLTFGTSITAPVITGVAGKTHTQAFVYDGTGFVATGADQQID